VQARRGVELLAEALERVIGAQSLLAEAGRILAGLLDLDAILAAAARLPLPALGDVAIVDLGPAGRLGERAAAAHVDPGKEEALARALRETPREAECAARDVLRGGPAAIVAPAPAPHPGLAGAGVRSALVVPLVARGACLGVLTLGRRDREYTAEDLALAEELGRRVALAADNAWLLQEAQRERARAEEASRAKDVFLATVSHELRTPLTAVVGWTQMLRAGAMADEKRGRALEIIDRNAHALTQLVEDLVDMGRITAGKLQLQRQRAALAPLIEAALDAVRPVAELKGIRLEATLDAATGAADVDPGRLQQVVWNLACNAVKFTPSGGAVRVGLKARGGQAVITIEDTGQGIAPDLLPYIFDPFRQGPDETGPRSGLGLGLAIARRLIELHGGRVEAASEGPGRGARFTASIPLPPAISTDPQVPHLVTW
jgi:signal transduction histidine kinase